MKKIWRNGWVQTIFYGVVAGIIFILLDNKFKFFAPHEKNGTYKGVVEVDKDKMYFTTAKYSEFEYNFGKVKEGDTVHHVFKLTNTGEEPLIIYKSAGSCECIGAFSINKSILPDSTVDIEVYFKTIGRKGSQLRSVTVTTNTDPADAVLVFKGEVE